MANSGTFKKGEKKPNQGKRGPGKATVEFRTTVQQLLVDNRDNVAIWLKNVAEGSNGVAADPAKALDLLAKLAEYGAPKLSRTEMSHSGSLDVSSKEQRDAAVAAAMNADK